MGFINMESFNFSIGRQIGKNYKILEHLGGGWEGEVYKVEELMTGIVRTAKFFYKKHDKRSALLKYAKKLNTLKTCPIIIQYHHKDSLYYKKQRIEFLISDYVDGAVLSEYVNKKRGKALNYFEALHVLYAIALGVEHIHFLGEYHGDIHADNILIKRKGIGFDVKLIDLFDDGKPTKEKIKDDVYNMISLLYEMIGGAKNYQDSPNIIKSIILGKNRDKIVNKFKVAGQLRIYLENMDWE